MTFFVGKAHYFIFDGRAVTWAYAFDFTAVHWSAVNIAMNNFMSFLISIRQPTYVFVTIDPLVHIGEGVMVSIACLFHHVFKVKGTFVYASWRPRFKAHQLNAII